MALSFSHLDPTKKRRYTSRGDDAVATILGAREAERASEEASRRAAAEALERRLASEREMKSMEMEAAAPVREAQLRAYELSMDLARARGIKEGTLKEPELGITGSSGMDKIWGGSGRATITNEETGKVHEIIEPGYDTSAAFPRGEHGDIAAPNVAPKTRPTLSMPDLTSSGYWSEVPIPETLAMPSPEQEVPEYLAGSASATAPSPTVMPSPIIKRSIPKTTTTKRSKAASPVDVSEYNNLWEDYLSDDWMRRMYGF
jgi:hypothetical protein